MQRYFEKIIETSQDYIAELQHNRKKWESEIKIAKQQLDDGVITQKGYDSVIIEAQKAKESLNKLLERNMRAIKADFYVALDDYLCPKGELLDSSMVELLNMIPLTADEFIKTADRYRGNPTMERVLVRHKVANKLEVNWMPESASKIKQTFDTLIIGAISAAHMEKIEHVKYNAAKAYHTLRCSNDDVLPVPDRPADYDTGGYGNDSIKNTITVY